MYETEIFVEENTEEIISENDLINIKITINQLLHDYIEFNIKEWYKYTFHDDMKDSVNNLLVHLLNIDKRISADFVEDLIENEIEKIYEQEIPIRSLESDIYIPTTNFTELKNRLNKLFNIPLAAQRTDEWYENRRNRITASSASKVLGSQCKKNEIICEKCNTDVATEKVLNTDTALHWGVKYEPISSMYYEYIYDTKLKDLGCVTHPMYPFIGASPDGINCKEDSKLFGRMLEIKNPISREITGIPKDEYWIQMQIQMEVCNLDSCDFLETKFVEYESKQQFDEDGNFSYTQDSKLKGIIMNFGGSGNFHYEYAPIDIDEVTFEEWEKEMMKKNEHLDWISNIYWKLEEVSCVLVIRNSTWFYSIISEFKEIWDIIEKERISGEWRKRLPINKYKKKQQNNETSDPPQLLIHLNKKLLDTLRES